MSSVAKDLLESIKAFVVLQNSASASSSSKDLDELERLGSIIENKASYIVDSGSAYEVLKYVDDMEQCAVTKRYVSLALEDK